MSTFYTIACPKCGWKPSDDDTWMCSCGHVWNTFHTHGVCPACHKKWSTTQCTSSLSGGCLQWSPHEQWYNKWAFISSDHFVKEEIEVDEPAPAKKLKDT